MSERTMDRTLAFDLAPPPNMQSVRSQRHDRTMLLRLHARTRAAVGLSNDTDLTLMQLAALHDPSIARGLLAFQGIPCDLHSACALGRVDDVRRLATPKALESLAEDMPPLGFGLLKTQLGSVRALIESGDDPNRWLRRVGFFVWEVEAIKLGFGRWSPLHAACAHGYAPDAPAIVKVLLDAGGDLNAPCPIGDRPIHLAATYGWLPVLETLVEAGADVDSRTVRVPDPMWQLSAPASAQNAQGFTPLMIAAREGRTEALRWLLARGAEVNAQDSIGDTPLHAAARPWWGEKPGLVAALLDAGAEPGVRDFAGATARDLAGAAGYEDTSALLA